MHFSWFVDDLSLVLYSPFSVVLCSPFSVVLYGLFSVVLCRLFSVVLWRLFSVVLCRLFSVVLSWPFFMRIDFTHPLLYSSWQPFSWFLGFLPAVLRINWPHDRRFLDFMIVVGIICSLAVGFGVWGRVFACHFLVYLTIAVAHTLLGCFEDEFGAVIETPKKKGASLPANIAHIVER